MTAWDLPLHSWASAWRKTNLLGKTPGLRELNKLDTNAQGQHLTEHELPEELRLACTGLSTEPNTLWVLSQRLIKAGRASPIRERERETEAQGGHGPVQALTTW